MQIVGVQLDSDWEDPARNLKKVEALLGESDSVAPDSLVVLPEMFATGFTMNATAAVAAFEITQQRILELARRLGICIVAGAAAAGTSGPENRAIVVGPAGLITSYTKLHPFSLGGEKDHYHPGERITTFEWQGFTIAPFVCYDLRFPEVFRAATKKGATLFVVIANWPISRAEHWTTLLRARAIENQAYVLGINRTGRDPNTLYGGRSILVDPMGVIRCDAGDAQTLLKSDIDPKPLSEIRSRFPFLADRRTDF